MIWELALRDYEAVATGRRTALALPLQPLRIHPDDRFYVVELGSSKRVTVVVVTDVQIQGDWQILSIRAVPTRVAVETPTGRLEAVVESREEMRPSVTVFLDGQLLATVAPGPNGPIHFRMYPRKGDVIVTDFRRFFPRIRGPGGIGMHVVIARPGEPAQTTDIAGDLASLQAAVGGWIELWAVDGPAAFLGNDKARLLAMPFNRFVPLSDGTVWDIYGPIVVVGHDADAGTFTDLPASVADFWVERLNATMVEVKSAP